MLCPSKRDDAERDDGELPIALLQRIASGDQTEWPDLGTPAERAAVRRDGLEALNAIGESGSSFCLICPI